MIPLIIECMLLGIVAALIGIFYNYTLQSGSIFRKLGSLLDKWSEGNDFKAWISNSLGACIYCSTTWITIFIMISYWLSRDSCPDITTMVICTLAAIGVQHLIIRIFVELNSRE
jgi:hypothetical protein